MSDAHDVEKSSVTPPSRDASSQEHVHGASERAPRNAFVRFEKQLIVNNFEARGIRRVEARERHDMRTLGYAQIVMLWFSVNLAANNITLGMLGPIVYKLGFLDASLCAVFGMLVGCLPVAFIATFGPRSGNRTLVFARYTMGWWPAKLVVVLNIIIFLGYSLIDSVIAGQIISAVSNDRVTVIVGIVIVAVITWIITTFGYQFFHHYERYAWFPQLVVLSILAGVAGPNFDLSTPSTGEGATLAGTRLSFFSLCLAAAITYSGSAADYFVYYPEDVRRWKIFAATMFGLTLSFTFAFILGIGLATGSVVNQAWSDAVAVSQGGLIVAGFAPLNGFGGFCGVIVALGLIANMVLPTYSSGVDFQILGRFAERVPRVVWNTVGVIIYMVCALAGRENLQQIFTNFLALMGYWVCIWFAIMLEEHFIFRRKSGYDWTAWNDRTKLPLGIAALLAFLIGWAGAILSMDQVWYKGPIAALVGDMGADLGNYVSFSWAALVYPPMRYFELKKAGR